MINVEYIHDKCITINNMLSGEERNKIIESMFISIGEKSIIRPPFMLDSINVTIGNNCYINHSLTVLGFSSVSIGNNVGISSGVTMIAIDHPDNPLKGDVWVDLEGPIEIGDDSWIGAGAIIMPNVKIGKNVKVGAGSVVVKDIPDNAIVIGNPARVIKYNDNRCDSEFLPHHLAPTLMRG